MAALDDTACSATAIPKGMEAGRGACYALHPLLRLIVALHTCSRRVAPLGEVAQDTAKGDGGHCERLHLSKYSARERLIYVYGTRPSFFVSVCAVCHPPLIGFSCPCSCLVSPCCHGEESEGADMSCNRRCQIRLFNSC